MLGPWEGWGGNRTSMVSDLHIFPHAALSLNLMVQAGGSHIPGSRKERRAKKRVRFLAATA